MAKYGLSLHPEKTRLVAFAQPKANPGRGKGPGTFDFWGFTHYWRRTQGGRWRPGCKTRKGRLRGAITNVTDWCRSHRHLTVQAQHAALTRRIQGHFNYFGVNGNLRALEELHQHVQRAWYKWLRRRSQRARLNWERFEALLRDYPLPRPRIRVQIWSPRGIFTEEPDGGNLQIRIW